MSTSARVTATMSVGSTVAVTMPLHLWPARPECGTDRPIGRVGWVETAHRSQPHPAHGPIGPTLPVRSSDPRFQLRARVRSRISVLDDDGRGERQAPVDALAAGHRTRTWNDHRAFGHDQRMLGG